MPDLPSPEDTLALLEDRGPRANPFRAGGNPVFSRRGLVASSHTLASLAGVDMLRRGGGAMDAAIAAAATLAVVEPTMTGIGGDAFFLYYEAERRSVYGFNGSGRSPRSLASEEVLRPGRAEIETDSWDLAASWWLYSTGMPISSSVRTVSRLRSVAVSRGVRSK